MSYIRSLSNPEGLYVWRDVRRRVYFSIDGKQHFMPFHVFNGLMKRAVHHSFDRNEVVRYRKGYIQGKDYSHIVIGYAPNKWSIKMWEVTFEYIAQNWQKSNE